MEQNGIIVPTEIDTTGFKAGSQELKNAMDSLIDSFKNANEAIEGALQQGAREGAQAIVNVIDDIREQIDNIRQMGSETMSLGDFSELNTILQNLETGELKSFEELLQQLTQDMPPATEETNKFARGIYVIGQALKGVGKGTAKGLLGILKIIATTPFKMFGGIGKLFGMGNGGIKGMFQKLLKPITSFTGRLKGMLTRRLFMHIFSGIREGFQNLANYSKEARASLTSLKSSLGLLKNSLATAFAPILNVIAPIIKTFCNMLARAISYVSQFISALTGKSTYIRAKEYVDEYTTSTKGASKATKELEKQLAGFDDLEILQDTSKGGGGGSGGGASPSDMFETVPIDNGIADFIEKIKEQFAEGNFYEVGETIANALNTAIAWAKDHLNWDVLGDKIREKINKIAGIFNGLVDNINWRDIGIVSGNSVNVLLNSLNEIFSSFHWSGVGSGIADALNGFVESRAISNAFTTLSNAVNTGLSTINGFLSNFNFEEAGKELVQSIKNFFTNLEYDELGKAIQGAVEGVIDFAIGLVSDGEAIEQILENFLSGIGTMIENIDLNSIINGIAKLLGRLIYTFLPSLLEGALKGLLRLLSKTFRKVFGNNFLSDWIDDEAIPAIDTAFDDIGLATNQGLKEWNKTVDDWFPKAEKKQKTNVTGMGKQIATTIKNDKTISNATSAMAKTAVEEGKKATNDAKNIGKNVVSGIGKGLEDNTARNTLWSKARSLGNTLISKIKSTLQIASPSKVMADEVGVFIPLGIAEGMEDSEPKMLRTVSDMAGAITKQLVNESYDVGFVAGDGLENGLSTFADKVVDTFEQLAKRLEAITDRITFRTPAIASGIVPYSLQDGATRSNNVQTEELQRQVINAIAGASTVIVRAINANGSPNITIDSQSLTDSVVAEINRRTRQLNASPLI